MSAFKGFNVIFRIWKAFPKKNVHKFCGTSVENPNKSADKNPLKSTSLKLQNTTGLLLGSYNAIEHERATN
jgi:hypothetical protein